MGKKQGGLTLVHCVTLSFVLFSAVILRWLSAPSPIRRVFLLPLVWQRGTEKTLASASSLLRLFKVASLVGICGIHADCCLKEIIQAIVLRLGHCSTCCLLPLNTL